MAEIYERIEELCAEKGINITTMCKECGISRSSLTDLKMKRVKTLSVTVLSKIADYFSVSVDCFLGNDRKDDVERLKIALFGGAEDVSDEMWNEVKRYAMYIKERENANR